MGKKNTIRPKISKLIKALQFKYKQTYLYNTEQVYSKKLERVCTKRKLFIVNTETGKRKEVFSSFREVDILLHLVDVFMNNGGEQDGNQEKDNFTEQEQEQEDNC